MIIAIAIMHDRALGVLQSAYSPAVSDVLPLSSS